jgi:predicted Zn-dependent protease
MNYGFQGLGLLVDRALISSNEKSLKEADQLGIQYAWNAGFDPQGFIAFLDSLAKERDFSRTSHFILTKPSLNERLLNAFAEIRFLPPRKNYTVDSAAFRAARDRINRSGSVSLLHHGAVLEISLSPLRGEFRAT